MVVLAKCGKRGLNAVAARSQSQPVVQHSQPVHSVWLMKWAPRICWAAPNTNPASNALASHQRAAVGALWRSAK